MTAREEYILASQTVINKGVVLDILFESIGVEEGVNINDVFIGDKNAILMATRVLGYGADYTVEITDPFTLEKQSVTIDLSKVKTKDVDESILNGDNKYKFKLPNIGKVEFLIKQ
jgi:electron transfer flavoprotein alpha/beta subunit